MLKTRIIPCLDVADGRVVKGVNFVNLIDAGDPVEAAKAYDAAGADEAHRPAGGGRRSCRLPRLGQRRLHLGAGDFDQRRDDLTGFHRLPATTGISRIAPKHIE